MALSTATRAALRPFVSALGAQGGACSEAAASWRLVRMVHANALPHAESGASHVKPSRQRVCSPWSLQFSSHLGTAAPQPVAASYSGPPESSLVEEWLTELEPLRGDVRNVCVALLSRHPELLYSNPARITATVRVLADSIRDKGLMRPWFFSDKLVLQLVERHTPDALRSRLSQLHSDVWAHLDDEGVASLVYAARASSMDLLDLDARSLAAKAHKLRGLVPHFTPSTVLRAVPELQDVEPEELGRLVHRVGQVVAIAGSSAAGCRLELRAQPDGSVHVVRLAAPPPRRSNGGAMAFDDDAACAREAPGEVVATLPNVRSIIFVDDAFNCDVRFEVAAEADTADYFAEAEEPALRLALQVA